VHEQNRRSWNAVVDVHESHRGDQVRFFRDGGSTLFPEELALLGDLRGCRLAHLMCNAGQDTISLAGLGAAALGVDISDAAIERAQELAAASGSPARFERANVYDWLSTADAASFERLYMGYGAVCWLSDLQAWAEGVARVLAPGGRLALVDFHPTANMFDAEWRLAHPYDRGGRLIELDGVGDYVGASAGGLSPAGHVEGSVEFKNPEACYLSGWGLGEIVTAVAAAGLRIAELREYPYLNGERKFERMRNAEGRRLLPPDDIPELPLLFGLAADKR
jgi:SAM-dependent methyltransferase